MLNKIFHSFTGIAVIILSLITFGCAQQETEKPQKKEKTELQVTRAVATIQSADGQNVTGTVTFTKTQEGTEVSAQLNNLSQGKHGFHIHEYGDCSNRKDFSSAGGHYNPTNQSHGSPTADQRHVGDMGNVPAGPEGVGEITYTDPIIQLNGKHNVIGRAVIIHAGEDDLESQPSGAAGARIGCGVIGIAETQQDTAASPESGGM